MVAQVVNSLFAIGAAVLVMLAMFVLFYFMDRAIDFLNRED